MRDFLFAWSYLFTVLTLVLVSTMGGAHEDYEGSDDEPKQIDDHVEAITTNDAKPKPLQGGETYERIGDWRMRDGRCRNQDGSYKLAFDKSYPGSLEKCHDKCFADDACYVFEWNSDTKACHGFQYEGQSFIAVTQANTACYKKKAINGGWSEWSHWTLCSNGTKTKTRACDNPIPLNGGNDCDGDSTAEEECHTCVACSCQNWNSTTSTYSRCHPITSSDCTAGFCVKCESDGKTPMPGSSGKHAVECFKYKARIAMCTDGLKNQDETDVDCGGDSCDACPTCTDGLKNQNETDVDCGGDSCDACPTCTDGLKNQHETDVDCGGDSCDACPVYERAPEKAQCSEGRFILDMSECKKAAVYLKLNTTSLRIINYESGPKGCFSHTTRGIFFNIHATGWWNYEFTPICIKEAKKTHCDSNKDCKGFFPLMRGCRWSSFRTAWCNARSCFNKHSNCNNWPANYCTNHFKTWMEINCSKTCGCGDCTVAGTRCKGPCDSDWDRISYCNTGDYRRYECVPCKGESVF